MSYAQEIERLKEISTYYLPLNTAESGLTAEQIKEKTYAGLFYLLELLETVRQNYAAADTGLANDISALSSSITALAGRVSSIEVDTAAIAVLQNQVAGLLTLTASHTATITTMQTAINTINANITTLRSDIVNGVISSYKAIRDGSGNVITTTYATKAALALTDAEITKIKNGTTTVGKASSDQDGNIIDQTYVKKSQIVDALTSTSTTAPLSANQGKQLKALIDALSDYIYSGAANTSIDRLAEVFAFLTGHDDDETLDGILAGKVSIADLVDALDSQVTNKALTANQGYVLKGLIDSLTTTVNAKADAADVYTKQGAEDMVDEKLSNVSNMNVIADELHDKNYSHQLVLRSDGELVLRVTEIE